MHRELREKGRIAVRGVSMSFVGWGDSGSVWKGATDKSYCQEFLFQAGLSETPPRRPAMVESIVVMEELSLSSFAELSK